jgi:hypothetical protein
MKTVIEPEARDPQHPYRHLQPIVDFLEAHGNEITTDKSGFYLTQGGWVCDFRHPIDYGLINDAFNFPSSIHFGKKENAILCDRSWAEIRGGIE